MGRQPRSGDIPWLSAHSILNWIGGDALMLILFSTKSSAICRNLQAADTERVATAKSPICMGMGSIRPRLIGTASPCYGLISS